METRILIPSAFTVVQVKEEKAINSKSLRVGGESSDETEIAESHSTYSDSSCDSSSSLSSDEQGKSGDRRRMFKNRKKRRKKQNQSSGDSVRGCVRLCAKESIDKGTVFGPNDGEIRIHHLQGIPDLIPDDVRYLFGCFDRLTSDPLDDSVQIRLCNWVRFLRRSLPQQIKPPDRFRYKSPCSSEDEQTPTDEARPNVLAKYVDGRPVFEVKEVIPQGKELIATFDIESLALFKHSKGLDGPLDLTKGSSPPPSPSRCSPVTPPLNTPTKESHLPLPKTNQMNLSTSKLFQPYSDDFLQQRRSSTRTFLHSATSSQPQGTTSSTSGSSSTQPTSALIRPILRTRGRERSLLPCEVCGKAFDRPSLLKRHMRTHTGEKPHVCDVCSKGFSTSSSLNTHRRIHSGEKPHVCPVCGKRFTASSNLYYHRMTHNKEKPHKCVLCGKSFPTPGDLKSHQYVHSGSWPFTCPVCHRGFSKQTNLRNHLLLHSGDKPHNCHICSKKFALACNLRAHLRTHEDPDSLHLTSTSSKDDSSFSGEKSLETKPPGSLQMPQLLPIPRPTHNNNSPGGGQGINNTSLRSSPSYPSHHAYLHPFLQLSRGSPGIPCSSSPGGLHHPTANPFLERLFQWNLDFAQSAVGNLSVMQQRLVESQMLAAQLMIHGSSSTSSQQHQPPLTPPLSSLHSPMMFGFGGGIVGFEELLARIRPHSNTGGVHGNPSGGGSVTGGPPGANSSIDLSKLMRQ